MKCVAVVLVGLFVAFATAELFEAVRTDVEYLSEPEPPLQLLREAETENGKPDNIVLTPTHPRIAAPHPRHRRQASSSWRKEWSSSWSNTWRKESPTWSYHWSY